MVTATNNERNRINLEFIFHSSPLIDQENTIPGGDVSSPGEIPLPWGDTTSLGRYRFSRCDSHLLLWSSFFVKIEIEIEICLTLSITQSAWTLYPPFPCSDPGISLKGLGGFPPGFPLPANRCDREPVERQT
jgi:hypothetical protein